MRRIVALSICLFAIAGIGAPTRPGTARAAHDSPPNVLVIVTDDQRAFGTLQVMPKLMKLIAGRGVRFKKAYATTPQCCPSRASIMTGQYAHNHGVRTNQQGGNLDASTTIQRHLYDAGYRTGLVGKYLINWPIASAPPYFHEYYLFRGGYYNNKWNLNGTVKDIRRYSTDFIATRTKGFIERAESDDATPWYLYVAPWAPHESSIAEKRYREKEVGRFPENPATREDDCSDKPRMVDCRADRARIERDRRKMLRTLMSVDDLIQKVDRTLAATGEARNTLVIFMSDNGYMWGEHGLVGKKPPYRGGIEIPMTMRWPAHVDRDVIDRRLVANIDIAPTVYEAAGITPQTVVDGHSLLDDDWKRSRLLLEYKGNRGWPDWASILTKRNQFTEYFENEDDGVPLFTELYRLRKDPWQLSNVLHDRDISNNPSEDELSRWRAQLDADRRCAGETCP